MSLVMVLFAGAAIVLASTTLTSAQLLYPSYAHARFMSNAPQKTTREILVSVVKNITEDTPVGDVLFNFRAEDKSSPTYNLT
jgi:hypothetical protein